MSNVSQLESIIEEGFEHRANYTPSTMPGELKAAIDESLNLLNDGTLRVAEKKDNDWRVNQWLKKAVLLSFGAKDNQIITDL